MVKGNVALLKPRAGELCLLAAQIGQRGVTSALHDAARVEDGLTVTGEIEGLGHGFLRTSRVGR